MKNLGTFLHDYNSSGQISTTVTVNSRYKSFIMCIVASKPFLSSSTEMLFLNIQPHSDAQSMADKFLRKDEILIDFLHSGRNMVILNQFLIAILAVIVVAVLESAY